jgi:hypothetical protein
MILPSRGNGSHFAGANAPALFYLSRKSATEPGGAHILLSGGMPMRERLAKLIDVKSLVTFLLTVTFSVLAFRGDVTGQEFQTVFTVVIGFYFGTQAQKRADARS